MPHRCKTSWLMGIQSCLYRNITLHPEIISTKLPKLEYDTTLLGHHCKNVIPRYIYFVGILLTIHHSEDESTIENNWKRAKGPSKYTGNISISWNHAMQISPDWDWTWSSSSPGLIGLGLLLPRLFLVSLAVLNHITQMSKHVLNIVFSAQHCSAWCRLA